MVAAALEKDPTARVLILTHRAELLTQAGGTLQKFGIRSEAITADNRRINHRARAYVGLVETFNNRAKKYPWLLEFSLVIIDEAHRGEFLKVLKLFPEKTFIIGATATPLSAKKSDPLSNHYHAIVNPVQIPQLIAQGYLVPAVTYSAKIDRSALVTDRTGDYSDASQLLTFAKRAVYEGLISKWQTYCQGRKTMVFNVNVAHSLEVTEAFNAAGISARHVDGTTEPDIREEIFRQFKRGDFEVLCNVGIATTGFDEPSVSAVVMNRATTSIPLWLQCTGRGSRLHPGKSDFVILDMGGNYAELGLWEEERDWETLWSQVGDDRKKKFKPAKTKPCPECEAVLPVAARSCHLCGYQYPAQEFERAPETEFVRVSSPKELLTMDTPEHYQRLAVEDLERLRNLKSRPKDWAVEQIRQRCPDEKTFKTQLRALAKARGYHPFWVNHQEFRPAAAPHQLATTMHENVLKF